MTLWQRIRLLFQPRGAFFHSHTGRIIVPPQGFGSWRERTDERLPADSAFGDTVDLSEDLRLTRELFADAPDDDWNDQEEYEVIGVGASEPLPFEWEEKHRKYRSMSQAGHEALCFRKVPVERDNPCGFHIPGVRR
ncbi:hypothetical protein [Brevundimonas sp.]|uniref:hypothetical protein n=1 Tax=Brevundimonas sp. TaxID=1871086 RepID=UPI00289C36F9|nr:hypothetical protein [Brevundimonas sp.]